MLSTQQFSKIIHYSSTLHVSIGKCLRSKLCHGTVNNTVFINFCFILSNVQTKYENCKYSNIRSTEKDLFKSNYWHFAIKLCVKANNFLLFYFIFHFSFKKLHFPQIFKITSWYIYQNHIYYIFAMMNFKINFLKQIETAQSAHGIIW